MANFSQTTKSELSPSYTLAEDGENILSKQVKDDDQHRLEVSVDPENSDVTMTFSSRQALYDFARSLLHEAVYGKTGQKEFYPLVSNGKALVVNGARLSEESSRVFVIYPQSVASALTMPSLCDRPAH